ncbi:hypothetical protein TWF696_009133 [Orbilia brochopaga]|uniref:Secreted protein n=1 Tax=Orbilia brochopaga TaxID=3140254 RepID=A0AAV9UIT2_9PEZI
MRKLQHPLLAARSLLLATTPGSSSGAPDDHPFLVIRICPLGGNTGGYKYTPSQNLEVVHRASNCIIP